MRYETVEKLITIVYALLSPLIGFILAVFEMAKRS
jgi:hypothetical protein